MALPEHGETSGPRIAPDPPVRPEKVVRVDVPVLKLCLDARQHETGDDRTGKGLCDRPCLSLQASLPSLQYHRPGETFTAPASPEASKPINAVEFLLTRKPPPSDVSARTHLPFSTRSGS